MCVLPITFLYLRLDDDGRQRVLTCVRVILQCQKKRVVPRDSDARTRETKLV